MAKWDKKFSELLEAPVEPKDLPAWFYSLAARYDSCSAVLEDFKNGRGYYRVEHNGDRLLQKAEELVSLVTGTMALEGAVLDTETKEKMVKNTMRDLSLIG